MPTPWLLLTNSVHSNNTHNHIKCPCLDWFLRLFPVELGRKKNERKNRKRKSSTPRDLQTYGDRVEIEEPEAELSPHEVVVLIMDTKATTCYGCKGRVQKTASDPPPPTPNNVFLRHMEHRRLNRQGETKIRISATPEAVYYHPLRSCAPSATSTNIKLVDSAVDRLTESTKQLLWREFGIRFI